MRVLSGRRPEFMLLASLLIFVTVLAVRAMTDRPAAQVAVDTSGTAPAPVELSAQETIAKLQDRIRHNPDDTPAYAQLGVALLQRVRETADPTLYAQAQQAFDEVLKRDPKNVDAMIGQGSLALSRHQFTQALQWGEQARELNPYRVQVYGIIGDAQNELGRYDEANAAIQKMVDTRPELSSYSRVSYVRELHGDIDGAIKAMNMAVESGILPSEGTLWTQVQLGNLYFNRGDIARAEQIYLQTLQAKPDYIYAFAGIARVRAAQGKYDQAIDFYRRIVNQLPLPEFVITLGEVYQVTGNQVEAKNQYDLVRAIEKLYTSAGADVDMELAVFDADHGADPVQTLARARASYARRPSIYGADALAWALYHSGNYAEARRYSQESLRLGTRDATLHYHAGMIANALGDKAAAREQLQLALDINPYFSVLHASEARALLARLK